MVVDEARERPSGAEAWLTNGNRSLAEEEGSKASDIEVGKCVEEICIRPGEEAVCELFG